MIAFGLLPDASLFAKPGTLVSIVIGRLGCTLACGHHTNLITALGFVSRQKALVLLVSFLQSLLIGGERKLRIVKTTLATVAVRYSSMVNSKEYTPCLQC